MAKHPETDRNYHALYLFRSRGLNSPKRFILEKCGESKKDILQTLKNWKFAAEEFDSAKIVEGRDYKVLTFRASETNIDSRLDELEEQLNPPRLKKPKEAKRRYPCWVVHDVSGEQRGVKFADSTLAFDYAAEQFAKFHNLPVGKYHLQWEIILKDAAGLTRVYGDKSGTYRIVIEDYGV